MSKQVEHQIGILRELAYDSHKRIVTHQYDNGLIPASVGRFDDSNFHQGVWIKDAVRAAKSALDPFIQKYLPELENQECLRELGLIKTGKDLYLSTIRGLLQIQTQKEQWAKFDNRPGPPGDNGYYRLEDYQVPAIKFSQHGHIWQGWNHHQPDNWGTLLLESGKGIETNLPLLAKNEADILPNGQVLQKITSYIANLKTERLICRSIWEHEMCWSSYSTRRIVHAGLVQMNKVWSEIENDSTGNYKLDLSKIQLQDSIGSLEEKIKEHFPADYTHHPGHESAPDLASLVVLNDIELPQEEQTEIITRSHDLENRQGFYRYFGDHWKIGRAEAKWTMGKPIVARFYFQQFLNLAEMNPRPAFRALGHGWDRIADILDIKKEAVGYIPELFEEKNGVYEPNNNELAWTLGYIKEVAGAGIAALSSIK